MTKTDCPDCNGTGNDLEGWCGDHECCDLLSCNDCEGTGEKMTKQTFKYKPGPAVLILPSAAQIGQKITLTFDVKNEEGWVIKQPETFTLLVEDKE